MAKGIDVYTKYQTVTNWSSVRSAGYEFAYVKASDGTSAKDTGGWGPKGRAADVKMGAYHYAQPGDAVAQANLLVDRAVSQGLSDLAPALDLESPFVPNQAAINFAIAFLRQVKARGHRPCLYANNSMLSTVRGPVLAAVPETVIWVARYGASPTVGYTVWQHSDAGKVPGITASSVDLNQGDIPLNTLSGGGGGAAPSAPTTPASTLEDEIMSMGHGEPTAPNTWGIIHVPVNGHRYLRIASSYGVTVNVSGISLVDDTPGAAGSNVVTVQGSVSVAPDRPGPWDLNGTSTSYANFSHVVIRYQSSGPVDAWVNDRP